MTVVLFAQSLWNGSPMDPVCTGRCAPRASLASVLFATIAVAASARPNATTYSSPRSCPMPNSLFSSRLISVVFLFLVKCRFCDIVLRPQLLLKSL